jgi:deferrochelatase/peroxidase EfeB
MPCPHSHRDAPSDDGGSDDEQLSRRQMIKAAVAIGGASGLSACLDREVSARGTPTPTEQQFPTGPADLSTLPERQHAWVDWLVRDRFGNTVLPQHQTILLLDYVGPDLPDADAREAVESVFRTIERAYQRGTGGDESAVQHEGLLFAVGYSPSYFDRFDDDLPDEIDLPTPEQVMNDIGEDDPTADDADAVIHLAAGYGSILLTAEQALTGDVEAVNGISVTESLADYFEVADRRTGFFGRGQPAQRYDADDIPESAPLSMGFKSGYLDTLPSENRITIRDGPFAGGTTMQVSRLEHDLDSWYDHDHSERTHRMFSPEHGSDDVGTVGEDLASASRTSEDIVEAANDADTDVVGHGQKIAHARDDSFQQPIMRRDFNPTDTPGLHFDSWQRDIEEFVDVRRAMNGEHMDTDVADENDGILAFTEVTNRGTFLMPPRSLRALPAPNPGR